MTDEQRLEAALRAGPPEEPVYRGDVASRIEARRAGGGSQSQPPSVHEIDVVDPAPARRRPWLAVTGAAAAAAVVVIGLTVVTGRDEQPTATAPGTATPTTTPTTQPTSVPSGVAPSDVVGRWVAATPGVLATPNPAGPAFLVITESGLTLEHLSGGVVNDFTSQVTRPADGELRLTLLDQTGRCAAGARGEYRWTLSPGGTTLTLDVVDDECGGRAAAVAGPWTRSACPTRFIDCLGPLEPGHHASVNFDPFDSDAYGEVAYDVPAGWSSPFDDKQRLTLLPPGGDESAVHGLYMFADVVAATADCGAASDGPTSATAIVSALAAMAELSVSAAEATVDGYQAHVLDISAGTTLPCADARPILTSRTAAPTPWNLSIGERQRIRLVLIELPDDRTMAIAVASDRSAAEYAQLLDAATAVIESLNLSATP